MNSQNYTMLAANNM